MDDLAAALLRLPDAFPDDPGPAGDPFTVNDPFDEHIWLSHWSFAEEFDFVGRTKTWTPRILRLVTSGRIIWYETKVPARFLEAGWREWPPRQRTAVEDVLRAWWTATLAEYPSTLPAAGVLVTVAGMTGDVLPWLSTWSAIGGVAAARQLCDFIDAHLSWSPHLLDFDEEAAEDEIERWMLRDGVDILCALPPGPDGDTALAELAQRQSDRWWSSCSERPAARRDEL